MNVQGRKTMVNTAMVFMAELSHLAAMAIAFIVALSFALVVARALEVSAILRFN